MTRWLWITVAVAVVALLGMAALWRSWSAAIDDQERIWTVMQDAYARLPLPAGASQVERQQSPPGLSSAVCLSSDGCPYDNRTYAVSFDDRAAALQAIAASLSLREAGPVECSPREWCTVSGQVSSAGGTVEVEVALSPPTGSEPIALTLHLGPAG